MLGRRIEAIGRSLNLTDRVALRECLHCIALAGAMGLLGPFSCGASGWDGVDARVLGQGGVWAVDVVERSPGAPVAPGISLGLGSAQPFAGSGLMSTAVRAQCVRPAWGMGFALSQLRSDVHRQADLALGLQLRRRHWAWGAALGLGALEFARHEALRELSLSGGLGVRTRVRVAAVVESVLEPRSAGVNPRLVLAASAGAGRGLELAVQCEREPRFPLRVRAGATWRGKPLDLRAGYDTTTRTASAGLAVALGPCTFAWGASSHPDLGWSHAWMLEFRRS